MFFKITLRVLFSTLLFSCIYHSMAGIRDSRINLGYPGTPTVLSQNSEVAFLPFFENWDSGQFENNFWTAGDNWEVATQGGSHGFTVQFSGNPQLNEYESKLQSCQMSYSDSGMMTPYSIWLDFEITLDGITSSSKENLVVEVWNGTDWVLVKNYTNTGDFNWIKEHLNITILVQKHDFKIRFKAYGEKSDDIISWLVDNISVYPEYDFSPPENLVAINPDTLNNKIELSWEQPQNQGSLITYIFDDGTAEGGIYFDSPGEIWFGSEFTVADTGIIQSVGIFMQSNGQGNTYSIDVFDSERNFIGTSGTFSPIFDEWSNVALPDIPYQGSFYIMLHIQSSSASDFVVTDCNGPNAGIHQGWFFDGTYWNKLSDFGLTSVAFNIRALCKSSINLHSVSFEPGSASGGSISPLGNQLKQLDLNIATGSVTGNMSAFEEIDGYYVYRRVRLANTYSISQNNEDFELIAELDESITNYTDTYSAVTASCYFDYYVRALYAQGLSGPSDTSSVYIYISPPESNIISANPAYDNVRVLLSGKWKTLQLVNSQGLIVSTYNVEALNETVIPIHDFKNGSYYILLRDSGGNKKTLKLLICQ